MTNRVDWDRIPPVLAPSCGGEASPRLPARLFGRPPGRTAEPCAVPASVTCVAGPVPDANFRT
jgi:hypothetical protein